MHLDLETEIPCVEADRGMNVIHDIAETRGHGSILSLLGLARDLERMRFVPRRQRLISGGRRYFVGDTDRD